VTSPSRQGEGARAELPPTLIALDRARASVAAWSFSLRDWVSLSQALEQLRVALWERERGYPATMRATQRHALILAKEALALIEAEHLAPEVRAVVLPLVQRAAAEIDRLAGHAPVVRPSSRSEQC